MEGKKNDDGKLKWSLLPWEEMEEVVKVMMFGAEKYSPDNWKNISKERYMNALMRHAIATIGGEIKDPESGLSHLAHVICCALFAI